MGVCVIVDVGGKTLKLFGINVYNCAELTGGQQRIIRLYFPFPRSTRFRVYLKDEKALELKIYKYLLVRVEVCEFFPVCSIRHVAIHYLSNLLRVDLIT
jgi:hypothetical protein